MKLKSIIYNINFLLILIVFLAGCATGIGGMLRLQDRELLVHPDKPGLAYPHKATVCKSRRWAMRWLGKKCYKEQRIDFYDLNKKETREKLINAGFTCKSAMRFKY